MNNRAPTFIALFMALLPSPGFSQSAQPEPAGLVHLKPGLAWKVESLPESQRILSGGVAKPGFGGRNSQGGAKVV